MKKNNSLDIDSICRLAEKKYRYWAKRSHLLKNVVRQVVVEIDDYNQIKSEDVLKRLEQEAKKIKAVWVISGTGTFFRPFTDMPGDRIYKKKQWAYFSDRDRIKSAARVISRVSRALVKESKDKVQDHQLSLEEQIKKYGPYLIYNGIEEQKKALREAIKSRKLILPDSKLFIPKGKIIKTLDQVKNFVLPNGDYRSGDVLVIVTHSAHYSRTLRMLNKYGTISGKLAVRVYPVRFKNRIDSMEFTLNEIMGVLGYIAQGEATINPIDILKR